VAVVGRLVKKIVNRQHKTRNNIQNDTKTIKKYRLHKKSSPVTGPEGPKRFKEVKIPTFRDNGTGWW